MPTARAKYHEDTNGEGLFEYAVGSLVKQFIKGADTGTDLDDLRRKTMKLPFAEFSEITSKLKLEPWQVHLCGILQSLVYTRGRRILVHKPPQHGGSILVSQRLPAYAIGMVPDYRVGEACFNIDKATEFTSINKMIMQSAEYAECFKPLTEDFNDLYIPVRAPEANFSTKARRAHRDGQSSLVALGLQTGFVGRGVDTLIIDDPYASPQEALSKTARKNVWTFWSQGAKVRIDDNANVIVMFHRYHEDDFVGQLIKEEGLKSQGGIWELYSYRAEWDGDERPEVGGPDPLRRKVGEYLSPRKAAQPNYYREQKRNPSVWLSQFQGKPSSEDGKMFMVSQMRVVSHIPCNLVKVARAWDIASTEDGDYTVGTLMGLGEDDYVYVIDVRRYRKNTDERNKDIRRTANRDRIRWPEIVTVLPQDPSAAGKDMARFWVRLMIGHNIIVKPSFNRGNKEQKADPWSGYVNSGYVRLVYNGDIWKKDDNGEYVSWVPDFVDEHKRFGAQDIDDQVDSASDAFGEIALEIDNPPGEDFDTMGFQVEDPTHYRKRPGVYNPFEEDDQDTIYAEFMALTAAGYYGDTGDIYGEGTRSVYEPEPRRSNVYTNAAPNGRGRYTSAQRKSKQDKGAVQGRRLQHH